jgi:hypothetical protein
MYNNKNNEHRTTNNTELHNRDKSTLQVRKKVHYKYIDKNPANISIYSTCYPSLLRPHYPTRQQQAAGSTRSRPPGEVVVVSGAAEALLLVRRTDSFE